MWYYISPTAYNEAEAQAAYNDAWLGDRIVYTAGAEYVAVEGIDISKRRNGTGKLLITTTEYDKFPAIGTRMTPAYGPLTATVHNESHKTGYWKLRGRRSSCLHYRRGYGGSGTH